MTFNPATDFLGLWRNIAGHVSKLEMPGLDYVVAALARAGLITLSVSATAPVVSQSTTAWLQAAVPSYSAEGALFLWNPVTAAYAPATPALLLSMLQTTAGQNGVSWWTAAGGPPINTVGNDGDYALRTDEPGGIYGPKVAGAWPAQPLPGTTDTIGSTQLDVTFGTATGNLIYRDVAAWHALPIGAESSLMIASGSRPLWATLSALLDTVIGNVRGDIMFRGAAAWQVLAPGAAGQLFATGGVGADPAWATRTAEFPSGTVMLFQQTTAPTGWTKQTAISDYGLRVVNGNVTVVNGTPFSTVFSQTTVGNTTLTSGTMPSHAHGVTGGVFGSDGTLSGVGTGAISGLSGASLVHISNAGGDGAHTHSANLTLAYLDVIMATKN